MKKISLLSFAAAITVAGSALASDFAGYISGGYSFVPVVSGAKGKINEATTLADATNLNDTTNLKANASASISLTTDDYQNIGMEKQGNAAAASIGFGYYVLPAFFVGVEGNCDQIDNIRYLTVDKLEFASSTGPQVKFSRIGASLVINGTVFSNDFIGFAMKVGGGYQRVSLLQSFSDEAAFVLAGNSTTNTDNIATGLKESAIVETAGSSIQTVITDSTDSIDANATLKGAVTYRQFYNAFASTKKANTFGVLAGAEIFFPIVQNSLDLFIAGTWNYTKPIQTIGDVVNITVTSGSAEISSSSSVSDTITTFAAVSPAHQLLVNAGLRAKF